jgi:ankyrin repeat protein
MDTLFRIAVDANDIPMTQLLLEYDVNPDNIYYNNNNSILQYVIKKNYFKMAELLINSRADINYITHVTQTRKK